MMMDKPTKNALYTILGLIVLIILFYFMSKEMDKGDDVDAANAAAKKIKTDPDGLQSSLQSAGLKNASNLAVSGVGVTLAQSVSDDKDPTCKFSCYNDANFTGRGYDTKCIATKDLKIPQTNCNSACPNTCKNTRALSGHPAFKQLKGERPTQEQIIKALQKDEQTYLGNKSQKHKLEEQEEEEEGQENYLVGYSLYN